jgi:hypothetical protein
MNQRDLGGGVRGVNHLLDVTYHAHELAGIVRFTYKPLARSGMPFGYRHAS